MSLLSKGISSDLPSSIVLLPTPFLPSLLQKYLYVAFPSETITRSGYQVRRKNVAVAAVRRGNVYCLGARWVVALLGMRTA